MNSIGERIKELEQQLAEARRQRDAEIVKARKAEAEVRRLRILNNKKEALKR